MTPLPWSPDAADPALHPLLHRLGEEGFTTPVAQGGVRLRLDPALPPLTWRRADDGSIRGGSRAAIGRAIGAAIAGLDAGGEDGSFATLGFMRDCSRNAVPTTADWGRWLRRACLLGFNQAMPYCEDTYQVPDLPAFGWRRGGYPAADLRAVDDLAHDLGIELVGCIQTLGHLDQPLRWPALRPLRDTPSVLRVGSDGVRDLIGRLLDVWAGALRSRRIHVGMDEAYDLGRGAHLDAGGAYDPSGLLLRHLDMVCDLCRERGLTPMIWSDLLVRAGSATHDYFDPAARIPPALAAGLPADLDLVFWDYYHADPAFYAQRLADHAAVGRPAVMATGAWTWSKFWYDHGLTRANAGACLAACRSAGVRELLVTLWGDDGGYCDADSALAGLSFIAAGAWGGGEDDALERRFAAVCGGDYRAVALAPAEADRPLPLCAALWDDPLLGIHRRELAQTQPGASLAAAEAWERLAEGVASRPAAVGAPAPCAGDLGAFADLLRWLAAKVRLLDRLDRAWASGDRATLAGISTEAQALADRLDVLAVGLRDRWLAHFQPFGLETLQIRCAGQSARWRELARRLDDVLAGRRTGIPELDATAPAHLGTLRTDWRHLASGSTIL